MLQTCLEEIIPSFIYYRIKSLNKIEFKKTNINYFNMGNFTWYINCTPKNAKVNLHAIITELKDNWYFDRFEDLLPNHYNYDIKAEILDNLEVFKLKVPEFITFEQFCSVVLHEKKLYGYIGNSDRQVKDNKSFIDSLAKNTELPPEGASILMYYEGFGPVSFILKNNQEWYSMMGYSNWSFSYYYYNLVKGKKECDKSEKKFFKKEEPQIKDFIEMFERLESSPEYFLRRGFKIDSNETYLETFRLMGFSDELILKIHSIE